MKLTPREPTANMQLHGITAGEKATGEMHSSTEVCAIWRAMHDAAPSGWQPIETAPKGRRILALVDGLVRFVVWGQPSRVLKFGWCLVDQGAEDSELCEPTHWMPLPAPPSEKGE